MQLRKNNESTPLQSDHTNQKPYNPIIYYSLYGLGIGNAIGLLPYAYSSGIYSSQGTTFVLKKVLKLTIADLPTDYGKLSWDSYNKFASIPAETFRWGNSFSEFFAALLQFEISKSAREYAESAHQVLNPEGGLKQAAYSWSKEIISSPSRFAKAFFRGTNYSLITVSFCSGTYPTIKHIVGPAQSLLGPYLGTAAVTYLFVSGVTGYGLGYGKKCNRGVEFWLSKPTVLKRYRNHHSIMVELQATGEGGAIITVRAYFSSFTLGELAQQLQLCPELVILFYIIGGASGFVLGADNFYLATHDKYHGHFEKNPVTQEERDEAYQRIYSQMTIKERAKRELKRGIFIGYLQTMGAFWLTLELGGPLILCVVASAGVYYISHQANLYRELNEEVKKERERKGLVEFKTMQKESVPLQVIVKPGNKQPSYDTFNETKDVITPTLEDSKPSSTAVILGRTTSYVQQVTRVPIAILSIQGNQVTGNALSPENCAALGTVIGGVAGENRDRTFRPDITETIDGLLKHSSKHGIFGKSSKQTEPSSSWRDWIPCLRKKR